jgi:putative transposase
MNPERSSDPRHRFPAEIISHAVWLYHVFSLSLRDVELAVLTPQSVELLALLCRQAAVATPSIALGLYNPGVDELRRRFKLRRQLLRRAAGVHRFHHLATELRCVGQSCLGHRRLLERKPSGVHETGASSGTPTGKDAKRFFRHLLKGLHFIPRVIATDKLKSYGVAKRQLLPDVGLRQSRYLNSRAKNSHRPKRRREQQVQRFKSPYPAQTFLSAHASIHGHFHPHRHLLKPRRVSHDQVDRF